MKAPIKVSDKSNDRRYFNITPRIVKALCRNPYDLALWETIREIAGEDGQCYITNEDLAVLSMMSTGQSSYSRSYLIDSGLLIGEFIRDPGYPQRVWHLSIPDLWQMNIEWCKKYPTIEARVIQKKEQKKTLHWVKRLKVPSPSEGKASPSEAKKNTRKNNQDDDGMTDAQRADYLIDLDKRYQVMLALYIANISPSPAPLMKTLMKNACKVYTDSTWYEPAFAAYVKAQATSWDYIERVFETWQKHGFGSKPPEWKQKPTGKQSNRQAVSGSVAARILRGSTP